MLSIFKNKIIWISLSLIIGLSLYNYQKSFTSMVNNSAYHFNSSLSILPRILYAVPLGLYAAIKNYSFLLSVKEDNQKLLKQNTALMMQLQNTLETKKENFRLKQLLNFKTAQDSQLIIAKVIGVDIFGKHLSININKGATDGVKTLQGVVSASGLVGLVDKVYKYRSQIVLLLSKKISVDSLNQRSRTRALVTGYKNGWYSLIYPEGAEPLLKDIKKGDVFVSSGLQNSFPVGLKIGSVERMTEAKFSKKLQILIKPAVSFNNLEEVFVIKRP